MAKPWRLTRQAEASLGDIARWTIETFGQRQADTYADNLIECRHAVAAGTALTQSCRALIDPGLPEDLRFTRSGRHFIVFVEYRAQVVIVDFLHARSDIASRLSELGGKRDAT